MTRPEKVHCFFEQSGTFKNEFRKIGIPAEDYYLLGAMYDHFFYALEKDRKGTSR